MQKNKLVLWPTQGSFSLIINNNTINITKKDIKTTIRDWFALTASAGVSPESTGQLPSPSIPSFASFSGSGESTALVETSKNELRAVETKTDTSLSCCKQQPKCKDVCGYIEVSICRALIRKEVHTLYGRELSHTISNLQYVKFMLS